MSEQTLQQLMQRYFDDPAFRSQMQHNPVGAAESAGFDLDEQDRSVLSSTDFSLPDEELKPRIAKLYKAR